MSRTLVFIALLLAVLAVICLLVPGMPAAAVLYLLVGAVLLHIISSLVT